MVRKKTWIFLNLSDNAWFLCFFSNYEQNTEKSLKMTFFEDILLKFKDIDFSV